MLWRDQSLVSSTDKLLTCTCLDNFNTVLNCVHSASQTLLLSDSRVRVHRHDAPVGLAACLNAASEHLQASLVHVLPEPMILHHTLMEKSVMYLDATSDVDVVEPQLVRVWSNH